ncbi:MAG: glycosyltransferase family 4 protein [Candidatus Zixiibacteriota bacterium]
MLQIAYDITSLTESPFGGVAQTCYNTLLQANNHPEIIPEAFYKTGDKKNFNISGIPTHKLSPFEPLFSRKYDIAHSLCHRRLKVKATRSIYTIYDVWSFYPNNYQSKDFQKHVSKRLRKDIQKTDHIITISNTTRNNLLALEIIPPEKCSTVYLGVNFPSKKLSVFQNPNLSPILNKKYVLFVGCLENRKNIEHILNAVLPISNINLVLAGRSGFGYEEKIKKKLSEFPQDRLCCINQINRNDLTILYSNAVATILPSWEEGFGLPILEAMACACPVITSNCSANAEISGDSAILVNPEMPTESQQAIIKLLDNIQFRDSIIEKGLKRVKQFSWENYYNRVFDIYKKVLF